MNRFWDFPIFTFDCFVTERSANQVACVGFVFFAKEIPIVKIEVADCNNVLFIPKEAVDYILFIFVFVIDMDRMK